MTSREILVAARAKVAQGWTQHAAARRADGALSMTKSKDAVCWCAVGAINAVATCTGDVDLALKVIGVELGHGLILFNDTPGRTQAEVLAVFDRAIARCDAALIG